MNIPISRSRLLVAIAAAVFFGTGVLLGNLAASMGDGGEQESGFGSQKTEQQTFEELRDNLERIVQEKGVRTAVKMAQGAFIREEISMYHCHVLAHALGHLAYQSLRGNFDAIVQQGIDVCLGGYQHGVEAEIVYRGGDFEEELYRFCSYLLHVSSLACYHGAGHGFMHTLRDPEKALKLCDRLTGGPTQGERFGCYTGVFSEYTNLLGGVDGDSGKEYPELRLQLDTPIMEFCASLSPTYQIACAAELNGYGVGERSTAEGVNRKLQECTRDGYSEVLQKTCIRSVAGVAAQHELVRGDRVTLYPHLLSLSPELRKSYVAASASEFRYFLNNGARKDSEAFCAAFLEEYERSLCRSIMTERKTVPVL